MQDKRQFSPTDQLIIGIGHTLETLFARPSARRSYPGKSDDAALSDQDRMQSAGYMRVNHVGEVCAQALYQSQALTASEPALRDKMRRAASDENDHLSWCDQRLQELGSRKSFLNPVWYTGSFIIGAAAGIAGDKWNLGFVAETEQQVVDHLESHLARLPEDDHRSREVVSQMQQDEAEHAQMAVDAGAAELPVVIKKAMTMASKLMTRTAFWI
jgi:ubiquinone biosynthesis monooxygenase Coq7